MDKDKEEGKLISIKKINGVDTLFFKNKNLYSNYAPKKNAEKVAESIEIIPESLYIIVSPLLNYGVDILKNRCEKKAEIFLIEINKFLKEISTKDVFYFENFNALFKTLKQNFDFTKIKKVKLIKLNNGYDIFKKQYDKIEENIALFIDNFWKNRLTLIYFKDLWMKNFFRNIEMLKTTTSIKISSNLDTIICGAGLSLENSLNFIKKNNSSFLIVAVDTAVPILLKHKINIDIIFVLESQMANIKDFVYKVPKNTLYITDLTSYNGLNRYTKNILPVLTKFEDLSIFDRVPFKVENIEQSGSVGIAAILYMQKIVKKIYLTGIDFNFVQTKTHSNGSYTHDNILIKNSRLNSIYKYSSNIIKIGDKITNKIMESYKKNLDIILSNNKSILYLNEPIACNGEKKITIEKSNNKEIYNFLKKELYYIDKYLEEKNKKYLEFLNYALYFFPDYEKDYFNKNSSFYNRADIYLIKFKKLLTKLLI